MAFLYKVQSQIRAAITDTPAGPVLRVLAQPKASRTEIVGLVGDRLKIRIAAPPVEGEANAELLRFLKKRLKGCRPELLRGEASRQKDVLCAGLSRDAVLDLLSREG